MSGSTDRNPRCCPCTLLIGRSSPSWVGRYVASEGFDRLTRLWCSWPFSWSLPLGDGVWARIVLPSQVWGGVVASWSSCRGSAPRGDHGVKTNHGSGAATRIYRGHSYCTGNENRISILSRSTTGFCNPPLSVDTELSTKLRSSSVETRRSLSVSAAADESARSTYSVNRPF